jgi:CheY-like chemotaxis protein
VLGIVRAHKGALKINSAPGQGTTFKILFPATDVEETAPAPKVSLVTGAETRDRTILVIDDEAIVRRTAKTTLERRGYDVVLAENGAEACELLRALANKISLVLLDLTMPGMDGEETLRELKMIRPDIRVLLSSGYNEVEVIQRFTGKGLSGFIQKPYTSAALVEKIRTAL